jgi:hypothetical protein
MMIDAKFDRNDYGLIPAIATERKLKALDDVRSNPVPN